jgi:hypothetical protein
LVSESVSPPAAAPAAPPPRDKELSALVSRLHERVQLYLGPRPDFNEQSDHLRHVGNRTRWIYFTELERQHAGRSLSITPHDDNLIEACVLSHDMGKWVPRDTLQALMPADPEALNKIFTELRFTGNENQLFQLGTRRRFALPKDGYTPEYDSAHHLASAFLLVSDPTLGFHDIDADDQSHLISMIVGHQFGSFYKETLLNLSMTDPEVTTGMLVDVARPQVFGDDLLASSFHDADISDLLFVGSLEARPMREPIFHPGGLVKILLINFTNCVFQAPHAPQSFEDCLKSCQATVSSASKEFLTATAVEYGAKWRVQGRAFLDRLREKSVQAKLSAALFDAGRPPPERLTATRALAYLYARDFLSSYSEL